MRAPLSAFDCAPSRCRYSGTSASGGGQRRPVLARMRQHAQRRADRPGHDGVDAQVRAAFPFVGKRRGERREARLGGGVGAPVGARVLAARVEREDDGSVRCRGKQRQRRSRQRHRRGDVDAQHLEPRVEGLVLDRAERAERGRRMHEPVQAAELRAERGRDVAEIVGRGRREIERQDRRLRLSGRDDLVVERLELAHDAPVQHDRRAARGAGERQRPAEPAGGAGDHDDAPRQIDGGRGTGRRKRHGAAGAAPEIGDRGGATAIIADAGGAEVRPRARAVCAARASHRIISDSPRGGIAQLGERLHGMQEVSGSIPLTSTTDSTAVSTSKRIAVAPGPHRLEA